MTIKQVIVMRTDLGMRRGKQISQGAHASMKVFLDRGQVLFDTSPDDPANPHYLEVTLTEAMREWVEGTFTKICVQVKSEDALLDIVAQAEAAGLPVALIKDAGKTEFGGVPTHTCCAIGPADADAINLITGSLPLY